MKQIKISLNVNGRDYFIETAVNRTLLDILREDLKLTGVKDACGGEGECGACTVVLNGEAVNSCLVLAGQANGQRVLTIEGLALDGELHPLQQAFINAGAVQCGFCTPGAVLAAKALLDHNPHPDDDEIREALSGNLCRCTGYTKMITAVHLAEEALQHG
ncbi:MAG: (2Fe-2S)-binding protein [Anaerolineae bacterium]|nr:(2Fe-2S)-binding protein [Anaerolineae bacterium]